MSVPHGMLTTGDALAGAVRDVRARWRLKHALRGAALTVAATAAAWLILSFVMRSAHYSDAAVLVSRVRSEGVV